jgi:hypothetical protein
MSFEKGITGCHISASWFNSKQDIQDKNMYALKTHESTRHQAKMTNINKNITMPS